MVAPLSMSPWAKVDDWLDTYQRSRTLSERVRLGKREGWFVLGRAAVLLVLTVVSYPFPGWIGYTIIAAIAVALLRDALLVATAHAFLKVQDATESVLRFVLLNLAAYLSLMLWCAIALAPISDRFAEPLNWWTAMEIGFAAITASATVTLVEAQDAWGSVVMGVFNLLALYWLLVILVSAVSRIEIVERRR